MKWYICNKSQKIYALCSSIYVKELKKNTDRIHNLCIQWYINAVRKNHKT